MKIPSKYQGVIVSVDTTWEWHPIEAVKTAVGKVNPFQLIPLGSGIQSFEKVWESEEMYVSVDTT